MRKILEWLAMAERMPEHENLPEAAEVDTEFRRVLRESKLSRQHPSMLGLAARPFSIAASRFLKSVRK